MKEPSCCDAVRRCYREKGDQTRSELLEYQVKKRRGEIGRRVAERCWVIFREPHCPGRFHQGENLDEAADLFEDLERELYDRGDTVVKARRDAEKKGEEDESQEEEVEESISGVMAEESGCSLVGESWAGGNWGGRGSR